MWYVQTAVFVSDLILTLPQDHIRHYRREGFKDVEYVFDSTKFCYVPYDNILADID